MHDHYLIAPNPMGPDEIVRVTLNAKHPVEFVTLPKPVLIGGLMVTGYPKLSRFDMTGHQGFRGFSLLMNLLEEGGAPGVSEDFGKAWQKLCDLADIEERITILFVVEGGSIVLYTFETNNDPECEAEEETIITIYNFSEPTMYQQGRILRHGDIVEQVAEQRRQRDNNLRRAFDVTDPMRGFNLHDLA